MESESDESESDVGTVTDLGTDLTTDGGMESESDEQSSVKSTYGTDNLGTVTDLGTDLGTDLVIGGGTNDDEDDLGTVLGGNIGKDCRPSSCFCKDNILSNLCSVVSFGSTINP